MRIIAVGHYGNRIGMEDVGGIRMKRTVSTNRERGNGAIGIPQIVSLKNRAADISKRDVFRIWNAAAGIVGLRMDGAGDG